MQAFVSDDLSPEQQMDSGSFLAFTNKESSSILGALEKIVNKATYQRRCFMDEAESAANTAYPAIVAA